MESSTLGSPGASLCCLSVDTLGEIMNYCSIQELGRLYLTSSSIWHGFRAIRSLKFTFGPLLEKTYPFPSFVAEMTNLQRMAFEGAAGRFLDSSARFWSILPRSVTSLVGTAKILKHILVTQEYQEAKKAAGAWTEGLVVSEAACFEDLEVLRPELKTLDLSWDQTIGEGIIEKLPRGLTHFRLSSAVRTPALLDNLPPHLTQLSAKFILDDYTPENTEVKVDLTRLPASLTRLDANSIANIIRPDFWSSNRRRSTCTLHMPQLTSLHSLNIDSNLSPSTALLRALPPTLQELSASIGTHNAHAIPRQLRTLIASIQELSYTHGPDPPRPTTAPTIETVLREFPARLQALVITGCTPCDSILQHLPPLLTTLTIHTTMAWTVPFAQLTFPRHLTSAQLEELIVEVPSDSTATTAAGLDLAFAEGPSYLLPSGLKTLRLRSWSGKMGPNLLPPGILQLSFIINITNHGLSFLPTSLTKLKLKLGAGFKGSDEGLCYLPRGIRHLNISRITACPALETSRFYEHFPPTLLTLQLSKMPHPDDNTAKLLPRTLQQLDLDSVESCQLTVAGLASLPPDLKLLSSSAKFVNLDGSCFAALPRQLTVLDLPRISPTDEHMALLPRSLTSFQCSQFKLTPDCIESAPYGIRLSLKALRRPRRSSDA